MDQIKYKARSLKSKFELKKKKSPKEKKSEHMEHDTQKT
jgi:hypothetical protein